MRLSASSRSNRKKILKLYSHIPPGSMSGFLQATLRATFRFAALLESARSTHGPREMWREAQQLILLVSVPMRLVHGRLALTFWASSCSIPGPVRRVIRNTVPRRRARALLVLIFQGHLIGGDGSCQALAWPDDPGEAASRRQALPRAAVQLASALRCLGLGVWWRRDSPSSHHTPPPLVETPCVASTDCISRPNGSQSRNVFGLCLGMRPPGSGGSRRSDPLGWPAGALETQAATPFGHWQPAWHSNAIGLCFPPLVPHEINRSKVVTCHLHTRAVLRGRGESHRFRHNKTRTRRSVPDPGVDEPRCDAVFPRAMEPALPNLRITPTKLLENSSLLVWMVNHLTLAWKKSYRMLRHVAQTLTRLRMPGHT